MTESDWLAEGDPAVLLGWARGRASERKLRLFACACCRALGEHLTGEAGRRAVDVAEAFADDEVLQETVILHAVKQQAPTRVMVSSSDGPDDDWIAIRELPMEEISEISKTFSKIPLSPQQAVQKLLLPEQENKQPEAKQEVKKESSPSSPTSVE